MTDPWNLTDRQQQVLAAIVGNSGMPKLAADSLDCSIKNVQDTLYRAKRRMEARTVFDALIAWDRWNRKEGNANGTA